MIHMASLYVETYLPKGHEGTVVSHSLKLIKPMKVKRSDITMTA